MKNVCLLVGLILFSSSVFAQNMEDLKKKIETRLKQVDGDFAVAFKDLQTGNCLYINEKENFHAASTMKTPVMLELYRQASMGKINLKDSLLIKNEFKSIIDGSLYSLDIDVDSDSVVYRNIGKKMSIYDLCYLMITVSSNFSTNILIEQVGAKNVMETLKKMGINDMQVLRGVEDSKAFKAGKNNTTTALDLCLLFEKIAQKQVEKADDMTEILLNQKFNEIIPSQLPKEVKVAHKTGSITGVQHDSGFIILPDGRKYVLVLLSKNLKNSALGVAALSDVSKMIYDALNLSIDPKFAAFDIIQNAKNCALITVDAEGIAHARAMDPFAPEEDFTIWLATNARSQKVEQIKNNPQVTLYYFDQQNGGYLSLQGKITLIDDMEEKNKHWKEEWKNFYHDRKTDYLLLKFIPNKAFIVSEKYKILGDTLTWKAMEIKLKAK